jgi:hypothetical protein
MDSHSKTIDQHQFGFKKKPVIGWNQCKSRTYCQSSTNLIVKGVQGHFYLDL